MKTNLIRITLPAVIMAFASGSSWSQQQQPIDCATAKDDIATLEGEKEKTNDKIAKGIFGFTPIGLLVNTADKVAHEDDQAEQKIKAYNEQIQQKIDSIKKTCNIQ